MEVKQPMILQPTENAVTEMKKAGNLFAEVKSSEVSNEPQTRFRMSLRLLPTTI